MSFTQQLGEELHIQATQVGNWIYLHNPQMRGEWVHLKELNAVRTWRTQCREQVRLYVLEGVKEKEGGGNGRDASL